MADENLNVQLSVNGNTQQASQAVKDLTKDVQRLEKAVEDVFSQGFQGSAREALKSLGVSWQQLTGSADAGAKATKEWGESYVKLMAQVSKSRQEISATLAKQEQDRARAAKSAMDWHERTATAAANAIHKEEVATERAALKAENAYKSRARSLREFSRWTGTVARDLAELSAVIMGPAILSSNAYTASVGLMEKQSRDLINANDKLKVSWINLGRAVAPELTNIQTITANILDSVAKTAEQNPAATKTVLDVAAGIGAVSAMGFVVRWISQLAGGAIFLAGTAGKLLGLGGGAAAAAAAGGTAATEGASATIAAAGGVAGIAAAVVPLAVGAVAAAGGTWLSSAIGNALVQSPALQGASGLGKLTQGQVIAEGFVMTNPLARLAAELGLIPGVSGHIFQLGNAADNAANAGNAAATALNSTASAASSAAGNLTALAANAGIVEGGQANVNAAAMASLQYGLQLDRAKQEYNDSFNRIIAQAGKAAEKANEQYWKRIEDINAQEGRQAAQAWESYRKGRDRSDRDFNEQIARETDDFNRQQERAAADHQKEMRRLEEDHRDKMLSLVEQRDALGIIREKRQYDKEKARSDADFGESQAERKADFERQLEEQRKAHKQQQDDRWDDYQDQLKQIAAAAELQRKEVKKNYDDQLEEIDQGKKDQLEELGRSYKKQKDQLKQAYILQLADLGQFTNDTQAAWGEMLADIYEKKTIPFATEQMPQAFADMYARILGNLGQAPVSEGVPPSSGIDRGGMVWPVSGPITQGPGPGHNALDISAVAGTPIHAARGGKVKFAGWSPVGYGNLTIVDHGGGLETYYAHQKNFAVGAGAALSQGQVLGYVDSTGNSTGNHLHFEVRQNGSTVNPYDYLRHMGGYTGDNWYRMQSGEYVLNRNTTAALERMTGGPLSQGSVVGGARIGSLVLAQRYDGRIAAGDRAWIEATMVRIVDQRLSRLTAG